MRVIALYKIIF